MKSLDLLIEKGIITEEAREKQTNATTGRNKGQLNRLLAG
jgi:hypothetical protein